MQQLSLERLLGRRFAPEARSPEEERRQAQRTYENEAGGSLSKLYTIVSDGFKQLTAAVEKVHRATADLKNWLPDAIAKAVVEKLRAEKEKDAAASAVTMRAAIMKCESVGELAEQGRGAPRNTEFKCSIVHV